MENSDKHTIDTELYRAISNGDEASFACYYENSFSALVSRTRQTTRNYDDAWDIAQDAFIKLWEQREKIDPDKSLDGLLSKMASDSAKDALKKKITSDKYHTEQLYTQTEEDHAADSGIISQETEQRVIDVIENMPPQRRKIFEMHRSGNITYSQIAEQLNLSTETVRMHMRLALKGIRDVVYVIAVFLGLN